jgi:hypothetical protein
MFDFTKSVSYADSATKNKFHSQGRAALKKLATALGLSLGTYDIRSNKGGIAVSGEVTLHGESIYIQVSQPWGGGAGILVRSCKGRKDYTGGRNNFLDSNLLNDIPVLAKKIKGMVFS